jgi:lysophospholipase L1-like esterase
MCMSADTGRVGIRRRHGARLGVTAATLIALAGFAGVSGAMPVAAAHASPYYLALGDSLAQGVQPNSTGQSVETDHGYVDDLYAFERTQVHGLRLSKLGCPGETTTTMIHGGVCTYASGNQLDDAVAFLTTHRVAFVTIDIGANNVDGCVAGGTVDQTCIANGVNALLNDLPVIVRTLVTAAPSVPIFAMNYYDPFLAAWLQGAQGQSLAQQSVVLAQTFNAVLADVYGLFGLPVADVASAFHTTDFTIVPVINLPLNVVLICAWTWMCAPPPVGPNIHANDIGYAVIAFTFGRTIGHL